jgi:hypothetical protein
MKEADADFFHYLKNSLAEEICEQTQRTTSNYSLLLLMLE